MTNKIKEAAVALLSKTKTLEEATVGFTAEEFSDLETLVKTAKVKMDGAESTECYKVDSNGQWKIEKAIKPGPALDYSAMKPKPNPEAEAKAPTIDYKNMQQPKPVWQQKISPEAAKEAWMKVNRAKRERTMAAEAKGIKLDKNEGVLLEEEPTSAQRKRMVVKNEGVLLEEEPTSSQKARMVVKNDMLGAGPVGQPSASVMMSEKEPHMDDPKHEEKEKKKAKAIKDKAQEILDLHKSVYNAGTHPPKAYDPSKKEVSPKTGWHILNHKIHGLEQAGKAGHDEHKKLTKIWETTTGNSYSVGDAGKELGVK